MEQATTEQAVLARYGNFLGGSIIAEMAGEYYTYDEHDKLILQRMCEEINTKLHSDYHFLAELATRKIPGAGEIVARYIQEFSSEYVKSCLLLHLYLDRVPNCDRIILQLYQDFKEAALRGEKQRPDHDVLYVNYDTAFMKMKSRRIKHELIQLLRDPLEVFHLPVTVYMLSSWKIPELREILIPLLKYDVPAEAFSTATDERTVTYIRLQLKFNAVKGLKNYPSEEVVALIRSMTEHENPDMRAFAQKTLQAMEKSKPR